jgi:hypothetical protein
MLLFYITLLNFGIRFRFLYVYSLLNSSSIYPLRINNVLKKCDIPITWNFLDISFNILRWINNISLKSLSRRKANWISDYNFSLLNWILICQILLCHYWRWNRLKYTICWQLLTLIKKRMHLRVEWLNKRLIHWLVATNIIF